MNIASRQKWMHLTANKYCTLMGRWLGTLWSPSGRQALGPTRQRTVKAKTPPRPNLYHMGKNGKSLPVPQQSWGQLLTTPWAQTGSPPRPANPSGPLGKAGSRHFLPAWRTIQKTKKSDVRNFVDLMTFSANMSTANYYSGAFGSPTGCCPCATYWISLGPNVLGYSMCN